MKLCKKKFNNLRQSWNHCMGSTTYAGMTPRFVDYFNKIHMLPRPYRATIDNSHLLMKLWIGAFIIDLAELTLHNLRQQRDYFQLKGMNDLYNLVNEIILDIEFCIDNVPLDLRLYGTFFTQATIVGSAFDVTHSMPPHLDKCDIITCLVTFGTNMIGGSTVYFNEKKPKDANIDNFSLEIPFMHGRIQIGTYCTIVHGISNWEGTRMSLSLNMKRKVINHFRNYGNYFFQQYKDENFPRENRLYN